MNIFKKIILLGKINKAVKEIKALKETNSGVIDEIIEIINDIEKILEKIKNVLPAVAELVQAIIDLVKKIIGK